MAWLGHPSAASSNDGPKHTKILVTNLPNVTVRQVIALYARRWEVELLIKELKGVTGLG